MTAIVGIRSTCLRPIADAFRANMDRTSFFQMWPTEIAFQGRRDAIFQCNAGNMVSGRWHRSIPSFVNQIGTDAFIEEFKRQAEELESQPVEIQHSLRMRLGVEYIEALLKENEGMQITMDSIFASIIMSSWTAFECLASDAWVAGVNNGPTEWRTKVIASRHLKTKGEENDQTEPKGKIDPARDFAGSLREARRVSFQRLQSIKTYYSILFDKKTIARLFKETSGGYIAALSQVRNVLTHKAGIIDAQFVAKVSAFSELSSFKENEPLLLDGETVKRLRSSACEHAAALLTAIDDVLSPKAEAL